MEIISSTKNKKILEIKALSNAKTRLCQSSFICEGEHMVQEAIASKQSIVCAVVESSCIQKYSDILNALSCEVLYVSQAVYKSISDTKTPQGISAVVSFAKQSNSLGDRIIALNAVQDPGNVGTIVRTANAAGFNTILLGENTADIYNQKTLRSTMGSIFYSNIIKTDSLYNKLSQLKASGYAIYATLLDDKNFYKREKDPQKLVLVIGNEGQGISDDIKSLCTHSFSLPMQGNTESLNAAIAAAIIMYDIRNR